MDRDESHDHPDDQSVTWVINHHVRQERRADFEAWLKAVSGVVERFPGHQGTTYLRPGGAGRGEYLIIVRFATYADLTHWESSPERAEWLGTLPPMLVSNPEYTTRTGMEPWFQVPGHWTAPPPPKYKMALLVGLAIYPLLLIVIPVMGILFGEYPFLANPFTLTPEFFTRTLVNSAILVPVMTWFAMPRLTKLFQGWLYPDEKGPADAEGEAVERDRK